MIADGIPVKKDSVSGLLHHKYLIIDEDQPWSDPIVVTGSANWTNATDVSGGNDENTVIIHDANLANEFYQEFRARYGPSANNTPGDASITPTIVSLGQTGVSIDLTVTHNDSVADNITKFSVYVSTSWTLPTASNTLIKRGDGYFYDLSTDVIFDYQTDGTLITLTCPSGYEVLSSTNGGTDANGKNRVIFKFSNFTAPNQAGPSVFSTKVDWASNPNTPELTEITPSPSITVRNGIVKINEVYFKGDATTDWVELYCVDGGTSGLSLKDWTINRGTGGSIDTDDPVKVLPDITMQTGQFLWLHWGGGTDDVSIDDNNLGVWDVYTTATNIIATNEQIILKDNLERYVDAVGWASVSAGSYSLGETSDMTVLINNGQWTDEPPLGETTVFDAVNSDNADTGYSIARSTDGIDTDSKSDWVAEANPTPGATNHYYPVINADLLLTEVAPDLGGGDETEDWIEVYCKDDKNNGNGVDINGLSFYLDSSSIKTITQTTIIKTGEYLLLRFDNVNHPEYGPDETSAGPDGTIKISCAESGITATDEDVKLTDGAGNYLDYVLFSNMDGTYGDGVTVWHDEAIGVGEWTDYDTTTVGQDADEVDGVDCSAQAASKWSVARNGFVDTNDKTDWYLENSNPTPGKPNSGGSPSGTMTVSPSKVAPSTSTNLIFTFNADSDPIEYYYIYVPTEWGDPATFSISVSGSDGGSFYIDGQYIVVNNFTDGYLDSNLTSTLTISNITSPATERTYVFTAGSKVVDGFPYELASSPTVGVFSTIIEISEVHFKKNYDWDAPFMENHYWVELHVVAAPSSGTDIENYVLDDLDGTPNPLGTSPMTVHQGDYVVVHFRTGLPDETDTTGDTNGNGYLDIYEETESLGTEDQILLIDGAGNYMDAVAWSDQDNFPSSYEMNDVQTLNSYGQWNLKGSSATQRDCFNSWGFAPTDTIARYSSDNDNYTDFRRTTTMTPGAANIFTTDGTGAIAITDGNGVETYYYASNNSILTSNTTLKFQYTAQAPISNGYVDFYKTSVDNWSYPDTANISLSAGSGATLNGFNVLSGWKVRVYVTSMDVNDTFSVTLSNMTTGTKTPVYFYGGSKIETAEAFFYDRPYMTLVPAAGDHLIITGPLSNGMMANDTTTFTIHLVDQYGNYASATDPNANCVVQFTIDDNVADNSEDINTTTLTSASDVSGSNDTVVTGNLVGGSATVKVIDSEPSTGQTPRILRLTVVDSPVVLSGSYTFNKDITIYPPLSVKDAYTVYISSSDKYRQLNVEFTAPYDPSTLGNPSTYTLVDHLSNNIGISAITPLTGYKLLRVTPATDLTPGETYTITVNSTILDGITNANTIVAPLSATFTVPYESGINIAVNSVNKFDGTTVAGGKYNLFPVWNPTGTAVAYISNSNGICNIYTLDTSNTTNAPVQITDNTENVLYFSQICWGDDGYLYYATYNSADNHAKLYRRLADGTGSPELLSTDTYNDWYDPDYCPAAQQPDGNPRVVVSIGGDLYVFDPNNLPVGGDNSGPKLIRLTQLSDEYDSTASRCLQPKWWWAPDSTSYPDTGELKIAFVYESRTDNSSQIYVLNDVENIITTAISENNTAPSNMVVDIYDFRLTLISHKPGQPNVPINNLPKWSPSWSLGNNENGGIISYVQDETGTFDNAVFNNVASSTAVSDALQNTNFNTYMTNWDDPVLTTDDNDVNYIPQIIANNPYNEAFMNWAPAGGDKITYIAKNGDTYTLSILPIQTNVNVGPTGGVLFDNSFTEVDVPANALTGNTMLSVTPPNEVPSTTDPRMVETGEVREFYADGGGITFNEPVTMIIHYSDEDQDGIVDGTDIRENDLKVWYYNTNYTPAEWELIGGDVDPVANTLTIQTNHFSTYGLFGYKAKATTTLDTVRIFPNPVITKDNHQITFDQLPATFDKCVVYNIAGEVVKTFNTDDLDITTDPTNPTVRWNLANDNGKNVASGLYILVIKVGKDSKYYKFAIIK